MFTVEWKKSLSGCLTLVITAALILLATLMTGNGEYAPSAIQAALLIYAAFSGWSVFRPERSTGAMEYMLSLPVPGVKLLLIKIIPRLIILLVIGQAWRLASGLIPHSEVPDIPGFSFYYYAFFAVSAAFSPVIRNFPAGFLLTASLTAGITFLTAMTDGEPVNAQVAGRAGGVIMIIPAVFVLLFAKFDLKPRGHFILRLLGYSFLIIAGITGIRWFGVERNWYYHLMTDEGGIYRMSRSRAEYIHEDGVLRMNKGFWPLAEQGPLLFLQDRMSRRHRNRDIFILDKNEKKLSLLYRMETGWRTAFTGPLDTAPVIKNTLFILERNYSHNDHRVNGLGGDHEGIYPLDTAGTGPGGMYMFHISENPLRFWIRDRQKVIIFSREGRAEQEIEADSVSAWGNRLLVFRKGTMSLYEAGERIGAVFKKEGRYRKVLRRYGSEVQEKVLVRNGRDTLIFGFNDQRLIRMQVNRNYFHYQLVGEKFYLVYFAPGGIALDIYEKDRFTAREILETGLGRFRQVLIFKKGVVVSNRRSYQKFLF